MKAYKDTSLGQRKLDGVAKAISTTQPGNREKRTFGTNTKALLKRIDRTKLQRIYEQKVTADFPFKPITNTTTSGVGAYQVDNRTIVLYINTFLPADYFAFESSIVTALFYANFYGLDRYALVTRLK